MKPEQLARLPAVLFEMYWPAAASVLNAAPGADWRKMNGVFEA